MACPMSMHRLPKLESPAIFDHTSIFALACVATILATAYSCSCGLLRKSCSTKARMLFIWHLFDALIHLTLGVSYLYNIFFTSMAKLNVTYTRGMYSTPMTPVNVSFLGDSKSLHGPFYGASLTAKLWQEYAKADQRWGGSDLSIVSLELITVFVMAPLALCVCHLLRREQYIKASFWMVVVAVGELYGGFMTFLPEWLSGSPHLDVSNFLTLWVYLVLFKALWTFFPSGFCLMPIKGLHVRTYL
ncbi:Emopamil-binding-related [Hyphodiscus hymeniophilus]|uniref:Emopamil-binding-related n=1 Tax=Hyphodiscus hymeniophilus TaxID=353542 RepID=A0A9P6VN04_9HELO|nr:Emopamil-binding-related [Hyphodiscus hymeniophilus]